MPRRGLPSAFFLPASLLVMAIEMGDAALSVEIWSDIACPFCYVGKRYFDEALRSFEHRADVTVVWRSFELDPAAPAAHEGDVWDNIARAYGVSREEAIAINARTQVVTKRAGLDTRFDLVRPGNMFDGHRLLHLARVYQRQSEMKERLLRAYFFEGQLIADHDTLRRLGVEVGIPIGRIDDMLATDAHADDVRRDVSTARQLRITGVPHFVVNRSIATSGAQPPAALRSLLEHAWEAHLSRANA